MRPDAGDWVLLDMPDYLWHMSWCRVTIPLGISSEIKGADELEVQGHGDDYYACENEIGEVCRL